MGIDYLNKIYTRYINLVEDSKILNPMNKKDRLINIDSKLLRDNSSSLSLTSNGSPNLIAIDIVI